MSWSVDVVKRHIASVESRTASSNERKLQSLNLARLCMKGRLYSEAIRYINQYLTLKGDDPKAYKLLGDIYREQGLHNEALNAYKRSLYFKKGQQDVIIAVGEVYCSMSHDKNIEKDVQEWLKEVEENLKYEHPLVAKLKKWLIRCERDDHDLIEQIMSGSPNKEDSFVVLKLAYKMMNEGQLDDSFQKFKMAYNSTNHIQDIELMRDMTAYLENLMMSLKKEDKNIHLLVEVMVLLLESLLDLFEMELHQEIVQRGLGLRILSYLIKFDRILYNTLLLATKIDKIMEAIITELKGQCYYLFSQYLLTQQPDKWQWGVVCLLATLVTPPINIHLYKSQIELSKISRWSQRSRTRLSICVRQLQMLIKEKGKEEVFRCTSSHDRIGFTRTLIQLFKTYSINESFIACDNSISQIKPLLLDQYEEYNLQEFDTNYICKYEDVLPAIVWLALVKKSMNVNIPFSDWIALLFPELSRAVTAPILTRGDTNTMSYCDIEAFLVLALDYCTNIMSHNKTVWYKIILPDHYISLYGSVRNLYSPKVSVTEGLILKREVNSLLSLVRCHTPLQLNMKQIQILARHFQAKAELLVDSSPDNKDTINVYLDYSKHYWSILLNQFTSEGGGGGEVIITPKKYTPTGVRRGTPRPKKSSTHLFSTHSIQPNSKSSLLSEGEKDECYMSLANTAIYQKDSQLALKYYRHVPTVQSSWNQSQIYVMLSESNEGDIKSSLLQQALSSIKRGMKQLDDTHNEDLVEKIHEEKERIQEIIDSTTPPPENTTPSHRSSLSLLNYEATPLSLSSGMYHTPVNLSESTPHRIDESPAIRERDVKIASLEKQIKYLTEQMIDIKNSQTSPIKSPSFVSPSQGNTFVSPNSGALRNRPLFQSPPIQSGQRPMTTPPQATYSQGGPFEFGSNREQIEGEEGYNFNFSYTPQRGGPMQNVPSSNLFSPVEGQPPSGKHAPLVSPPGQRIPMPPPFSINNNYRGSPPPINGHGELFNISNQFTLGSIRPPLLNTPPIVTTPSSKPILNVVPSSQPLFGPTVIPNTRPSQPNFNLPTTGTLQPLLGQPSSRPVQPMLTNSNTFQSGQPVPPTSTLGNSVPSGQPLFGQPTSRSVQPSLFPTTTGPILGTPINRPMLPTSTLGNSVPLSQPLFGQPTSRSVQSSLFPTTTGPILGTPINRPIQPMLPTSTFGNSVPSGQPLFGQPTSRSVQPSLFPTTTGPILGTPINRPIQPMLPTSTFGNSVPSGQPLFGQPTSRSVQPSLFPTTTGPILGTPINRPMLPTSTLGNSVPLSQPLFGQPTSRSVQSSLFPTTTGPILGAPTNRPIQPMLSTSTLGNQQLLGPANRPIQPTVGTGILGNTISSSQPLNLGQPSNISQSQQPRPSLTPQFGLPTFNTRPQLVFTQAQPVLGSQTRPTISTQASNLPTLSSQLISTQPSLFSGLQLNSQSTTVAPPKTTPTTMTSFGFETLFSNVSTTKSTSATPSLFMAPSTTMSSLFSGNFVPPSLQQPSFMTTPTNKPLPFLVSNSTPTTKEEKEEEESPVQSPDVSIEFTPIVTLPELNDITSGEENEEVMFSGKGKLYRFDANIKQWKERGKGSIKLLRHKIKRERIRVLMRRDQVLKICCNHYIRSNMSLSSFGNGDLSYVWFTPSDFAEEETRPEKFVVKFKEVCLAKEFKEKFDKCLSIVKGRDRSNAPPSVSPSPSPPPPSDSPSQSGSSNSLLTSSSSLLLGPPKPSDNWECTTCYVSNKSSNNKCVACGTGKEGVSNSDSLQSSKGLMMTGSSGGLSLKGFTLPSSISTPPTTGGISLGCLTLSSSTANPSTTGGFSLSGLSLSSTTTLPTTSTLGLSQGGPTLSSTKTTPPTTGGFSLGGLTLSSTTAIPTTSTGESSVTLSSSTPVSATTITGDSSLTLSSTTALPTNTRTVPLSLDKLTLSSSATPISTSTNAEKSSLEGLTLSSTTVVPTTSTKELSLGGLTLSSSTASVPATTSTGQSSLTLSSSSVPATTSTGQSSLTLSSTPVPATTSTGQSSLTLSSSSVPATTSTGQSSLTLSSTPVPATTSTGQSSLTLSSTPAVPATTSTGQSSLTLSSTPAVPATTSTGQSLLGGITLSSSTTASTTSTQALSGLTLPSSNTSTTSGHSTFSTSSFTLSSTTKAPLLFNTPLLSSTGVLSSNNTITSTSSSGTGLFTSPFTIGPSRKTKRDNNDDGRDKDDSEEETDSDKKKSTFSSFSSLASSRGGFNFNLSKPIDTKQEEEEYEQECDTDEEEEGQETDTEEETEEMYEHDSTTNISTRENTVLSDDDDKEDDVIFLYEDVPLDELIKKAEQFLLPKYFYNYLLKPDCPGCQGCTDEFPSPPHSPKTTPFLKQMTPTPDSPICQATLSPKQITPTSPSRDTSMKGELFSSALSAGGLVSFSDLAAARGNDFSFDKNFKFTGTGQQLFSSSDDTTNDTVGTDDPEEECPNIHFKPIVSLPETYTYQSKEEEESDVLFNERCKLYRFDSKTKQWKERGIGNMKIICYPSTGQTRLIMRRDQILKLCCNHYITSDMTIDCHLGNPKAMTWLCKADYSEETSTPQKFSIRFKLEATAQKFKELFEEATKKDSNERSSKD